MAVYSLNMSSNSTIIDGLENALSEAGILTTTHGKSSSEVVVSTTYSNKVLRFRASSQRVLTYYGDAYSGSGTTVTNEVAVNSFDGGPNGVEGLVLVTETVLLVAYSIGQSRSSYALFSRLDTEAEEYIAIGWVQATSGGTQQMYDTTNEQSIHLITLRAPSGVVSPSGYYYQSDVLVTSPANVLRANAVQGVKSILKPDGDTYVEIFGDHVVVPGGRSWATEYYLPTGLLIENGTSWTPS